LDQGTVIPEATSSYRLFFGPNVCCGGWCTYLLESYPMSPRRARGLGFKEASMPFSMIILASDMNIEHNTFEIVEGCAAPPHFLVRSNWGRGRNNYTDRTSITSEHNMCQLLSQLTPSGSFYPIPVSVTYSSAESYIVFCYQTFHPTMYFQYATTLYIYIGTNELSQVHVLYLDGSHFAHWIVSHRCRVVWFYHSFLFLSQITVPERT
jgi:hypothetical protein